MTYDRETREKLKAEIDTLPWSELIRHFAFGRVYHVRNGWSLVDAAMVMKSDDAPRLKQAMNDKHFGLPSDEDVADWISNGQEFEVLVMSPFVLVAPLPPLTEKSHEAASSSVRQIRPLTMTSNSSTSAIWH